MEQPDYQSALAVAAWLTGQGFSVQAWGLRGKLREAAAYRAHASQRLYEVHPELSFATMAGGPLPEPKARPAGQALRRSVLAAAGLVLSDDPAWRRATVDVLDAAACRLDRVADRSLRGRGAAGSAADRGGWPGDRDQVLRVRGHG